MTTLADYVARYSRTPSATVKLDGRTWRDILSLSFSQRFGENIAGGGVVGRTPPITPQIGMAISWTWGYNGQEVAGFTGEVSDTDNTSYPGRWSLQCKDVLWRADKSSQVLVTDPLNEITAKDAIIYLLTHYGGISASRLSIPSLSASGSAWVGSEWVLGVLTPVQWGDVDTESGGTTALKAAAEICSCLGYWLYADSSGVIRARQMERRPLSSARETFERGVNLLLQGAPERKGSYDSIYNQVTVRGAATGVDGSQIMDQFRTTHPLLPADVYRDSPFSSERIEYVNESEAGAASATKIAQRILTVVSRVPDVETHRAKADPRRKVGDTVGLIDANVGLTGPKNYFIYALDRTLDLQKGAFDDALTLDGGTGSGGFTTIPPPDAAFSWRLDAETLDGTAVVVVALDGSGSSSPTGEIVTWDWSTDATPYGGTASTATGVTAALVFPATPSLINITLSVTDTTSKIGSLTLAVDLSGAGVLAPISRVLSAAGGASWDVTPDGGATWTSETTNGDAVAVPPAGAGIDDRAFGLAGTYGLLATRGSAGAGGLRSTLDALATPSTNRASASGAIACIWVNEANPARVWWAIGDTIYRSIDGGLTGTAMATPSAGTDVLWIIEDPAVENSVFAACGADLFNATDPTSGWALLYAGPASATARQFVRSHDGLVTWVCYLDAPSGQAAQRVETGAFADVAVTAMRTLALDKDASSLAATLTLIDANDPANIYHVDGLTGLSAVTSPATFPAGATVMHMLADPESPVYYTADFDSIAAGTGAIRKLIADQLLLMKAGATGVQYHMLGFGGPIVTPIVADLLMVGGGLGAGTGVHRYTAGAWADVSGDLPVQSWDGITASPLNKDHWIVWDRSLVYRTTNAGVNWTHVTGVAGGAVAGGFGGLFITQIEFSPTVVNQWAAVSVVIDNFAGVHQGYVSRGEDNAMSSETHWTWNGGPLGAPVDQAAPTSLTYTAGDALVVSLRHDTTYFLGDKWITFPTGTVSGLGSSLGTVPATFRALDGIAGSVAALGLASDPSSARGELWSNNSPPGLVALLAADSSAIVASAADAAYLGLTGGIARMPYGGAAVVVYAAGITPAFVRADRQTRQAVAALYDDSATYPSAPHRVAVWDGVNWASVPALGDSGPLGNVALWLEVLDATA
jgi:hypothetical protein